MSIEKNTKLKNKFYNAKIYKLIDKKNFTIHFVFIIYINFILNLYYLF